MLSCSSSASELTTNGASCVPKGVASLALFLGLGLGACCLTWLSSSCLGKWEGWGQISSQGPWVVVLGWPRGPIASVIPALPSSCFVQAYASVGLVLCKPGELVLGHLVGGAVFVPGLPPSRRGPWINVDS